MQRCGMIDGCVGTFSGLSKVTELLTEYTCLTLEEVGFCGLATEFSAWRGQCEISMFNNPEIDH
jgi:hypothetical protein